jgi:hypothetical protein
MSEIEMFRQLTGLNSPPRMYRIVLACKGVPAAVGAVAACDITEEFIHRPWHQNVRCEWDGFRLILQAENDYDSNGLALLDEFSDALSASIADGFDGGIDVVSVSQLPTDSPTNRANERNGDVTPT